MRSDLIKEGPSRAPHRSLLRALGIDDLEMKRPFVAVVNSKSDYIPGHMHLDKIAEQVKAGIRNAGGVPFEFNTIGVCDGIAMNHKGMKYSLCSRELIADSIEVMLTAHPLDAIVFIPNCDKIVPGMLLAACRLNLPCIFISGGTFSGTVINGEDGTIAEGVSIPNLKFIVTFDNEGTRTTAIIDNGVKLTAPAAPTKEGYRFSGWYYDNSGSKAKWNFDTDTVTRAMTR